jgi:hypothetical protein
MLKTYDPAKVSVIIGGHIVQGYADGEFVTAARNSDNFARVGGADGEQTRAKSNDRSGVITVTLMQASLSNAVLQGFALADETGNAGIVPILIKDSNGSELATAEQAWCQKPSDKSYGKESGDRQWVFETGELIFAGGGIEAS